MKQKGFTLMELEFVAGIIALLVVFAFIQFNSAKMTARATKTVQDFKAIEKAIIILMTDQGRNQFWDDKTWGGNNPLISEITGMDELIPNIPIPTVSGVYRYDYDPRPLDIPPYYDNDTDTKWNDGVNIMLVCSSDCNSLFNKMDKIVDGGDGDKNGRLETDGATYIMYNIPEDLHINDL